MTPRSASPFSSRIKPSPAADAREDSAARYDTQGRGHNKYAQANAKNCRGEVHHKEWEHRQEPHEEQIANALS